MVKQVVARFNRPQGAFHYDFWSDIRDNTLESVGITRDIRDAAQPVIDYGKNQVLGAGQPVPDFESDVGSEWLATGYKYASNISPAMVLGAVVVVVAAYLIIKKG